MSKKTSLLFAILFQLCFGFDVEAQHDLTTSFIPEVWASSFSNPAWVPEEKFHIGLPSYYFNTSGTSVDPRNYVDFGRSNPSFDLAKFASELDSDFQAETQQFFHPLYFSVKLKNFRIGAEYSFCNNSTVRMPADLFRFAAFGNEPYVDQTLNLGPSVYSVTYQQLSLPISFEKSKWTIGLRPSILKGIISVQTQQSVLQLYTNPEYYQLELTGDYFIQSSGILEANSESNIGANLKESILQNGLSWRGNTGINLDVGIRYKHNDKLTFGLSAVGVGQITWDRDVSAFSSNGSSSFNGIDINSLVNGDSLDVDKTIDDLIETFQLETVNASSFKTSTPTEIYLNTRYELNEFVETAAVLYGAFLDGEMEPAFALNFRIKTGDIFSIGLSYGAHYSQWNHVGVNFLMKLGPVQIFAGTNNVFNISNALGKNSTNFRLGLSAAFDKKKKLDLE